MRILGVILAGGLARRMGGQDKALIALQERALLAHVTERFAPQVDALAINANGDAARFASVSALPVFPDLDDSRSGPLSGVLAGLRRAQEEDVEAIVTVAVDTPFFPTDLVARLRAAAMAKGVPLACAATGPRTHPVFGLWPVALADDLAAAMAEGTRKVDIWTGKHGCSVAEYAADPFDPFFNVNTPEDLAEAEAILARGRA